MHARNAQELECGASAVAATKLACHSCHCDLSASRLPTPLWQAVCGQLQLPYQGQVLDFEQPFARKTMHELVQEKTGVDFEQFGADLEVRGGWSGVGTRAGRVLVGWPVSKQLCASWHQDQLLPAQGSERGAHLQVQQPTLCLCIKLLCLCRRRGRQHLRRCASTPTRSRCRRLWPRRRQVGPACYSCL